LIIDDLAKVIYAPQKVFKQIIENPKYLGVLLVLLLFVGFQVGYEYAQFSKTYTEQTSPTIDQLAMFTNATYWNATQGATLCNNYDDFFNYSVYVAALGTTPTDETGYYNLFANYTNDKGPSSLEISAANSNNVSAAISNAFNVDCSTTGFRNLTITIKMEAPQTTPQTATLSLYSLSDSNFYTYDLTSSLSDAASNNLWKNFTLSVGPSAQGWTSSGSPSWGNVTSLKLGFNYPANSNITVRIGALFFHGLYQTPIEYNETGILLQFLQVFSLQFLFSWFLLTGLIYLLFKGLKASVTWKPLFIALGFALFVMVIRALVNLIATLALPAVYYPFDLSLGVRFDAFGSLFYPSEAVSALSLHSQAVFSSVDAVTLTFRMITSGVFYVSYVWLGGLCTIIVGALKPEFSMLKRIIVSGVSIAVTILLLLLLVGIA
jgi:hypothetical protein